MTQLGIDHYFTSGLMTDFEYSISRTVCSEYLLFFTGVYNDSSWYYFHMFYTYLYST